MSQQLWRVGPMVALYFVLLVVAVSIITHSPKVVVPPPSRALAPGVPLTTAAAGAHYPPAWRPRLLALLGAPRSAENLRLLQAWGTSEGGNAQWNPLNATYILNYSESWPYNSSLVQNYWRATGGIAANALTLIQDNYACIVGSLQAGQLTAEQIVGKCSSQFRAWGTNPSTILAVLGK